MRWMFQQILSLLQYIFAARILSSINRSRDYMFDQPRCGYLLGTYIYERRFPSTVATEAIANPTATNPTVIAGIVLFCLG
ncbi:hypothetical protein B0T13DRAFT_262434 [Neurospora crassa]|nr:hypothetical protein B0T13DRAFT_262434 [Neurospora crassa]